MSAATTRQAVEHDILAAEFLLGLLDDAEARDFGERAARDASLARRVTEWSERLEPLTALAAPVAPTPALWLRIASGLSAPAAPLVAEPTISAATTSAATTSAATSGRARSLIRAHPKSAAGIAAAIVVVVAGAAILAFGGVFAGDKPPITELSPVLPPRAIRAVAAATRLAPVPPPSALSPPVDRTATLDPAGPVVAGRPEMRASVLGAFLLRVDAVRPPVVPAGSEIGVWVQPRSERAPILIGRVNSSGGTLDLPNPLGDGDLAIVTAEPAGKPSRSRPGPVLLQGRFGAGG